MGKVIAFAGNPNVGKSTLFNALTGLKQHTGNWPGKTVDYAIGRCNIGGETCQLVDLPGCYSLYAQSEEEVIARDYICLKSPDVVVVVCDGTCLERNLNLVLQVIEVAPQVVVCVNLLDEAKKKGVQIDLCRLSEMLGVPVVGVVARSKKGMAKLKNVIQGIPTKTGEEPYGMIYPDVIELGILKMEAELFAMTNDFYNLRWVALHLLMGNDFAFEMLDKDVALKSEHIERIFDRLKHVLNDMKVKGYARQRIQNTVVEEVYRKANQISKDVVVYKQDDYDWFDRKLDGIFTSKYLGFPFMFLLLFSVFWITIVGANYPSSILAMLFGKGQELLVNICEAIGVPGVICNPLIYGVYEVLSWVVAVMLPPMAIFFPLFTLLEDFGYLPRVAFNMDKCFYKCKACGKQALTMCMGFGCNAVGVTGCRIIHSKRERLIAILTNNFVPCNGRFPTIIAVITMFLMGEKVGGYGSVLAALLLAFVIFLGVGVTFVTSYVLSKTLLKGEPSTFTLELPPYRKPQIKTVIIRSLLDRAVFVLGRAVLVAAPMGFCIWIMANVQVGGGSLLEGSSQLLQPLGQLMGLDGVILLGFILGFPANEIIMPIILMTYLSQGDLVEMENFIQLKRVLVSNGWTWLTACNVIIFSLFHWPCGTTLLTIKKETNSLKWTVVSFLLPTGIGVLICMLTTYIFV